MRSIATSTTSWARAPEPLPRARSPATSSTCCSQNGGYPKLPDYLHGAQPGSKYIVVGQKAYAAYSSSGRPDDITVTFSSRNCDCDGDGVNNWRSPTGGTFRHTSPPRTVGASTLTRRVRSTTARAPPAGLDVPAGRQPLRARLRPRAPWRRRLGRRRRHEDDGEGAGLERDAAELRLGRQDGPHVGASPTMAVPARLRRGDGPPALRRAHGRRAGGAGGEEADASSASATRR